MAVTISGDTGISPVTASGTSASVDGMTVGRGGGEVSTNTAVGASALNANTSGSINTAFGFEALKANTTGAENVAVGYRALDVNTTGTNNIAMGRNALGANISGSSNVAVGDSALVSNTTANANCAFGSDALGSNSTGASNVAVGRSALESNTTASNMVAVGYQALYSKNSGTTDGNVAVGYQAGYSSTSSNTNVFIGVQAGYYNTTGNSNVMIGSNAGALSVNATTGDANIYIGGGVRGSAAGNANEIVIGYLTTGKGSNTGFINPVGGGVYQGNNSGSWSTTSDQRLKKNIVDNTDGLDKITAVRVRNFEYRLPEEVTELDEHCAVSNTGVQLGVIAQELQAVLPDCVKTESTGVLSVDPDNLTWYMVNAIKELKAEFDAYKATHP
jgi:hypothetical protein